MKRVLACFLSALLLLSCAPLTMAEERTGEPIKLNLFSLNGDYNTANGEEAKKAVEEAIWRDLGIPVDLNMITSDSFSTDQIAVKVTAGELDAISSNMPLTTWNTFIQKHMLIPLDDLLAQYGQDILAQVDSKLWDPYKVDGKIYLIPIQAPVPFYCSTWVRMDLFRKYGIDTVPATVSELLEGIRTVVNNEPDLVGLTGGHITWIYNSGPMNFHLVDADGNQTLTNAEGTAMVNHYATDLGITVYWEDEGFKQWLQRQVDAYASGILDPEIFTTTFDHADQLKASDRVVCIGDSYGFQSTADKKAGLNPDTPLAEGAKPQEWVLLSNLVNDINGGATTWQYGYETGMFIGLVASTEHPEEVIKVLNWCCASRENWALANYGIEGKHYTYTDDGKIKFVRDGSDNKVVSGGLGGMVGNLYSDWWVPLTENFEGTDWKKIFEPAPTTQTWIACDGFINYQFETDATSRADMQTIASEALVNIITGKVELQAGLDEMVKNLKQAGYDQWYAEKNAQYCEGMGIK